MHELVTINGIDLPLREYNGKKVVTLKDIDMIHERLQGTARKRFNDNKRHFVKGEDFFRVCASEIRTHKIMDISPKAHEDVILITESGYYMLVKSFTDDLSWDVQRELVNGYFKSKSIIPIQDSYLIDDPIKRAERWIEEQKEKQQLQITVSQQETVIKEKDEEIKEQADRLNKQRPFVQCVKKIMSTDDTVDMGQAAKMLKEDNIEIGRNTLFKLLREHEILMGNNTPYQRYVNGGIFTVTMSIVEKGGYVKSYPVTRVTGKGLFFLNKKLREWFGMEDVNDVA